MLDAVVVDSFLGLFLGVIAWLVIRLVIPGFYTVDQNERAVMVTLGRAERLPNRTTLDDPMSATLSEEERLRYSYPQIRVIPPGGPYFKFPWQDVRKISVAIQTVSIGYDPESPKANQSGEVLEAVTKDQLNTGLRGHQKPRGSRHGLFHLDLERAHRCV